MNQVQKPIYKTTNNLTLELVKKKWIVSGRHPCYQGIL